jgi:hypothetical protein
VWRGGERTGAEHDYQLLTIGPCIEGQDGFERLAANDQGIYRGHEFIVAMRFPAARREEIEVTILSGDEPIETGPNKD